MSPMRSLIAFLTCAFLTCLLALPVAAQVQGQDYELLAPPQKPIAEAARGKVEIVEFFSYACPHCRALEPLLTTWAAKLPSEALLVRVPVSFGRREWGQLSRAYYALEASGQLAKLDHALFKALHDQHRALYDEPSLTAWVAEQGGKPAEFRAAFNSAEVSAKAMTAEQLSRDYQVSGVPSLSVAGKYVVLGRNYQEMLENASRLIEKSAVELAAASR